jgi:hypothetical protein
MAEDFAIESTATAEFNDPETNKTETVTSEPISVSVEPESSKAVVSDTPVESGAGGVGGVGGSGSSGSVTELNNFVGASDNALIAPQLSPVVDTTKQAEVLNNNPITIDTIGTIGTSAEVKLALAPLPPTLDTPIDLFPASALIADSALAATAAPTLTPTPTFATVSANEQPMSWSAMSIPLSESKPVDVGGVPMNLSASFGRPVDSVAAGPSAATGAATITPMTPITPADPTTVNGALTSTNASANVNATPAQQVAEKLLANDPPTPTDQAAVAQAIGQTGVTVANRVVKKEDPLGAFTDPNYGKNIKPLDPNTMRQPGATTNTPAFPNNGVTPQTGFDAIDRALNGGKGVTPKLDPAIAPENKKNLDGALPGNSNRDKLSDPSKNGTAQVNAMREQLAKAESQPMGQTGNNIDAINAAFKKIGTPTQGNLDEMAKLNQERPVNIFVPKPNSPTIPGGISDATMNKIKGTAPEYKAPQAPDGVNQALSRAIEQGTAMADSGEPGKAQVGAGLLTGAGVIQGIYNIPGNTKAAAGALAKDPGSVTSEDVGQAVQRFAIDGILGIPVGLGQFGAIATGTKVADVQRRAAESMEELSGGELTENARNLSTVAGAAAMALPIGKGTLGVAKAGAAKLGGLFEGGTAGQVGKTPNFVSPSLGRTVLNAEAETYVGKGPGPENIGSGGMGGALRDLTDTLRNQSAKGADVAVVKNFENWFGSGSPKPQEGYIRTAAERTTMADGSAASPLFERFVATEGGQPYAAGSLTDATIGPSHFVADANGAPRSVYHGSGAQFDAFAKADPDGMLGKGYYFTSEKPVATNYANRAVEAAPNTGAQPVVYDVALSLKKPYVITTPQLNVLWNSGKGAKAEIVDSIKNQGFDGLVFENKLGEKTYMIFDPTQIKSLQNNGQFDPKNPNMHSSLLQSPVGSLA